MVPSSRLLFWTGAIILPFSALAATLPHTLFLAVGVMGAFVLLAAGDAWWSRRRLDPIRLETPAVVRFARFQQGAIPVRISQASGPLANLRLGLLLPPDFTSPAPELRLSIPEAGRAFQLSWLCAGTRRGRYALTHAALEGASALGFWLVRRPLALRSELRVYPDLRAERKRVAATFLNRGRLGLHAWRQIGKGREFEKLREYQPGDSYEDIHWRATAKRNYPVTKVFQIERTQEVYALVDASRLSARAVPLIDGEPESARQGLSLLDRYIASALMLGYAADRQGDLFGLLAFSGKPELFLKAAHGKAHFDACREALYALAAKPATPDFAEVFSFVRTRLRKRALLIVLTSLDDPLLAENFMRSVRLVCRHHLVMVNMMRPPESQPLFSGADPGTTDAIYRRLGGHHLWRKLEETARQARRQGVRFAQLENESMSAALISQYMNMKQSQLL